MGNTVKTEGDSGALALQITRSARAADLVEESTKQDGEKEVTVVDRMAPLRTYAFDGFVLAVDRERVSDEHIVDLVTSVAEHTGTIYQSSKVKVQRSGHGFQIPVNIARDAGWEEKHAIGTYPATGVLGLGLGEKSDDGDDDDDDKKAKEKKKVDRQTVRDTVKIGELVQTIRETQLDQ